MRKLTKTEWKQIWQVWRSLDEYDRINFLHLHDGYFCWAVDTNRNALDPLLVKSVSLAISIEQSQMMEAA